MVVKRKLKIKNKKLNIFTDVDNLYTKKVTKFGSGAKIDCSKQYIGKDVIVIILKDKKSKKK